ncbi:hypothetical protein Btru_029140 [Bulinus truncatus]|nr:hypothetical protein Btru_029140 [Bulinus truncatus]
MPELSVDIAVANRFISSLSKSLQALCHGCMEFDTGIEIIGYININIDSGSKVDYVLNEKVLKSTNNSMTFVSNSFLAKKEQPRHTRDGSCSPIPSASISLPTSSQYQPRQRGSSYGAPFHRTSQFSPHSQVLHGSQKRQWGSDWRTSAKKHRPSTTSSETASFSGHTSYPSSSQTFTDTNFRQSSTPSVTDNKAEDDTEVINIKKEAVDTESEIQDHGAEQDQNNEDEKTDSSSKMKIKCDPDAAQPADIETDKDDTFSVKGSTDFKGTFLDPTHDASDEQNDLIDSEKQSETISKQRHSASDEHSVAGPSGEGAEESDDIVHGGENTGADLSLDYDQGNEDYPQSVHSDVGEASSDNGQFEVIEIDDEDEDVQAMFGDSQENFPIQRQLPSVEKMLESSKFTRRLIGFVSQQNQTSVESQCCSYCPEVVPDGFALQTHLKDVHGVTLPYICKQCGKGYNSPSGLYYHTQASHEKRSFLCPICDARFTRRSSIKSHLMGVHNAGQCPKCTTLVKFQDFNQHVQQCSRH